MSTTTPSPKKPPGSAVATPSTTRRAPPVSTNSYPAPSNGAPSRSPSRMAAQGTNGTSTINSTGTAASTVNRTRSARNGAPVSARTTARKPATGDVIEDEDARVELQAKLDELQEKLNQTEISLASAQKHAGVLQIKLDEALQEQTIMDQSVNEQTEQIEVLQNERKERERSRREMEQIYEAEREVAVREKEEMQTSLSRMKDALQQREIRPSIGGGEESERSNRMSLSRASSHGRSNNTSPNPDAAFAPSSVQRSESRSSSQLVMQKDRIIEGLRMELAEAQIKLIELENQGGGHVQLLEKDMYELRMRNARLTEENESFQLLLSEKTLNGDFAAITPADLLRAPSDTSSRPASRNPAKRQSLADELNGEDDATEPEFAFESGATAKDRRLQSEVHSLKDQNKALTLYINNIISRLLQHEQFEQILENTPELMAGPGAASQKYAATSADTNKKLPPPPPPPPKDDKPILTSTVSEGFLQRAGSVLRGRPTRPAMPGSRLAQSSSEQQPRVEAPTVHEHPYTAPKISLSRSRSTRAAQSGHQRANSDWPAANFVTNMYKGPPPASSSGPLSPGLGSPPGGRNSPFFPLGAGHRVASGSSVPTISEAEKDKENYPHGQQAVQKDSKAPSEARSNQDYDTLNPGDRPVDLDASMLAAGEVGSNPSSPPRSTTSSGDRDSRAGSGGAIMMGSKPRPLRLVQEAQDDDRARKAANRGSWFGWMNKGGPPGGVPAFMSSRSGSDADQGGQ